MSQGANTVFTFYFMYVLLFLLFWCFHPPNKDSSLPSNIRKEWHCEETSSLLPEKQLFFLFTWQNPDASWLWLRVLKLRLAIQQFLFALGAGHRHLVKVNDSRYRQSTTDTRQSTPDNQEQPPKPYHQQPALDNQHPTTRVRQGQKHTKSLDPKNILQNQGKAKTHFPVLT